MSTDMRKALNEINEKLESLVENGRPQFHEFLSVKLVVVLIIIGIITAIWSDLLMKRFQLKEGKNPVLLVILSIISVVAILLIMQRINSH